MFEQYLFSCLVVAEVMFLRCAAEAFASSIASWKGGVLPVVGCGRALSLDFSRASQALENPTQP